MWISVSIDSQLKELPGAGTAGGWFPEGTASLLGCVLTAPVVWLLPPGPWTERGGAARWYHCLVSVPNLTERSVVAEFPTELDLWRQATLELAVGAASSKVGWSLASALASSERAPPVAELSPEDFFPYLP